MAGNGGSGGAGGLTELVLRERHEALGARFAPFAGWEMPLQYQGIVGEHEAVRERVGVFDVSHLARAWVEGPQAASLLRSVTTFDVTTLPVGKAHYSLYCNEAGGIEDDVFIYHLPGDRWLVIHNAANADKDFERLQAVAGDAASEVTPQTVMLAVQGPDAVALLSSVLGEGFAALEQRDCAELDWQGTPVLVARTGYTGEDGGECIVGAEQASALWDALLEGGATPVGLGARDTLRLEGGAAAARQRHRRDHAPLRGRPGLRREPRRRGAVHGPRGAGGGEGAAPHAAARAPHGAGARCAAIRLRGARAGRGGARGKAHQRGLQPQLAPRHRHGLPSRPACESRRQSHGRRARSRTPRRGRATPVLPEAEAAMTETLSDLLYTSDHEWVRRDEASPDEAVIGITDFAQDQLGDVVYLDLPTAGDSVSAGERFGEIESVKTVSDLYAPISGEVLAANGELEEQPELVNDSPYEDGWLIRLRIADDSELDGLLDAGAYTAQLPAS